MNTNAGGLIVPPDLGTAGTNGLKDIKGLVPIPSGWSWVGWVAGGLLLLALGIFLWRRWRRKALQPKLSPAMAPHTIAYLKLRDALLLIQEPRPFCILVSDTIREYLEKRFRFHAPDRTTEEFLEEMQESSLLSYEQKDALGRFLTSCDLVKFARYELALTELKALHDAALRLVDETAQPEAPASKTTPFPASTRAAS